MKCNTCKYEYLEEWDIINKKYIIIKGDKEFININGDFSVYMNQQDTSVSLCACPKCKTVIMCD